MTRGRAQPATSAGTGRKLPFGVLVIACGATFLGFLDSAIVTLAYSAIAARFPGAGSGLTWIVSGYAAAFAALLATAGRLADTLGHRRVLITGVSGFALASAACAVASDTGVLIGARIVQGAGAALLLPTALSALLAQVAPAAAGRAIRAWAATGALAAAIGPAVGAVLVQVWGWRSLFVINLPICAALLIGIMAAIPASTRTPHRRGAPDVAGVLGLCGGIGAVVAAITEGHDWGYTSPVTVTVFAAGVLAAVGAVWRSRSHPRPALEVRLWRSRAYAVSNAVNASLGFAMFAVLLALPQLLQLVWRMSLLTTAGCIGLVGVSAMASAAGCGRSGAARWLCTAGMGLVAGGCAVFATSAVGPTREWALWSLLAVVLGAGVGVTVTGLSLVTAATVPATSIGAGLGLGLTARQAGGALGVAVLAAMLSTSTRQQFLASLHHLFLVIAVITAAGAAVSAAMVIPAHRPGRDTTRTGP
ncbi:MFS family permease [Nocardia sp. GAS34]|uniref:MFS transporter n=1 Tax=unclassified Nocardia TaxID=2637762 RepID=UPI003D2461DB